jgi:hypothetical protein
MKVMQNFILRRSFFALTVLFAVYGCKTTDNTIIPEPSVSNLKPESEQADKKNTGLSTPQASPVKMETTTTEKSGYKVTEKSDKINEESLATAKKNMIGKWSNLLGHGGMPGSPSEEEAATEGKTEQRPFIELEKKLYGKWINVKETESYEFHDDGTVIIIVTGQRGMSQKLKGNYKLVEEGRIKIDFKGDFFVSRMPPRHFKISVSANEFTLTDEPKGPDEPFGAATKYNRIE